MVRGCLFFFVGMFVVLPMLGSSHKKYTFQEQFNNTRKKQKEAKGKFNPK